MVYDLSTTVYPSVMVMSRTGLSCFARALACLVMACSADRYRDWDRSNRRTKGMP